MISPVRLLTTVWVASATLFSATHAANPGRKTQPHPSPQINSTDDRQRTDSVADSQRVENTMRSQLFPAPDQANRLSPSPAYSGQNRYPIAEPKVKADPTMTGLAATASMVTPNSDVRSFESTDTSTPEASPTEMPQVHDDSSPTRQVGAETWQELEVDPFGSIHSSPKVQHIDSTAGILVSKINLDNMAKHYATTTVAQFFKLSPSEKRYLNHFFQMLYKSAYLEANRVPGSAVIHAELEEKTNYYLFLDKKENPLKGDELTERLLDTAKDFCKRAIPKGQIIAQVECGQECAEHLFRVHSKHNRVNWRIEKGNRINFNVHEGYPSIIVKETNKSELAKDFAKDITSLHAFPSISHQELVSTYTEVADKLGQEFRDVRDDLVRELALFQLNKVHEGVPHDVSLIGKHVMKGTHSLSSNTFYGPDNSKTFTDARTRCAKRIFDKFELPLTASSLKVKDGYTLSVSVQKTAKN